MTTSDEGGSPSTLLFTSHQCVTKALVAPSLHKHPVVLLLLLLLLLLYRRGCSTLLYQAKLG